MKGLTRFFVASFLFTAFFNQGHSEIKWPFAEISDDLKQNVDVVIREDQMVFTVLAIDKATSHVHFVVTVLNENGNDYARLTLTYDKLKKINDFNAIVYDAFGRPIKRLKNSEIYDQSAFDGFSLYTDNRLKSVDLTQTFYPYTVEFEYQIDYKYLYSIPGTVLAGKRKSVQHASYKLVYPTQLAPRYRVLNIESSPQAAKLENGLESITWTFANLLPITFEPYGRPALEMTPQIIAAPSQFEYEGYPGNMSTWKDFGKWMLSLNSGRDILPEGTKLKVRELTKDLTTTEERSKVLYEYLQNRTRYVSIQLGIGGLQPFPASLVDQTGYGDCKALCNYMVALLKEAGIKGYYTIIQAGANEPDMLLDFPSHQSNHVIVAIPSTKDTLWLECTSQTNPFGYLGSFTSDRSALMITDDGGKIVRTPALSAEQNKQSRTAEVSVDNAGNATAKVRTSYAGIQYESGGLNGILVNQYDDQKKWIQNNTDIPSFTLQSFTVGGVKAKVPTAVVTLNLTLPRYGSVSGKRLFIVPNLMNKVSFIPPKIDERKTEVIRNSNYIDLDTIIFRFPENLYPEFIPVPVKIVSPFGEYEANYVFDTGKFTYTRRLKVWKGHFPKESYKELVDFFRKISKADNMKLVFLNKT